MQSHFTTVRRTSKWKWMVVHRHEDFIYLRCFLCFFSFIFWRILLPAPQYPCVLRGGEEKRFHPSFNISKFKMHNSGFHLNRTVSNEKVFMNWALLSQKTQRPQLRSHLHLGCRTERHAVFGWFLSNEFPSSAYRNRETSGSLFITNCSFLIKYVPLWLDSCLLLMYNWLGFFHSFVCVCVFLLHHDRNKITTRHFIKR